MEKKRFFMAIFVTGASKTANFKKFGFKTGMEELISEDMIASINKSRGQTLYFVPSKFYFRDVKFTIFPKDESSVIETIEAKFKNIELI